MNVYILYISPTATNIGRFRRSPIANEAGAELLEERQDDSDIKVRQQAFVELATRTVRVSVGVADERNEDMNAHLQSTELAMRGGAGPPFVFNPMAAAFVPGQAGQGGHQQYQPGAPIMEVEEEVEKKKKKEKKKKEGAAAKKKKKKTVAGGAAWGGAGSGGPPPVTSSPAPAAEVLSMDELFLVAKVRISY
jgi:hypothetical protein